MIMPKITNEEIEAKGEDELAQGHKAFQWQNQDQSIGLLDSKAICLLVALRVFMIALQNSIMVSPKFSLSEANLITLFCCLYCSVFPGPFPIKLKILSWVLGAHPGLCLQPLLLWPPSLRSTFRCFSSHIGSLHSSTS